MRAALRTHCPGDADSLVALGLGVWFSRRKEGQVTFIVFLMVVTMSRA